MEPCTTALTYLLTHVLFDVQSSESAVEPSLSDVTSDFPNMTGVSVYLL